MKTTKLFNPLILAVIIGVTLSSCRKDKDDELKDNDTTAAADNALAEDTFNDVKTISDEAADGSLTSYLMPNENNDRLMGACATITHDTNATPRKLTIDFGTTNCVCNDGRNRRGQIIVTYIGKYRDSASTHTIGFNNYFVNDNEVLGTKTVTNNGHNSAGNLSFTITVSGQINKANNGGTITWNSNRTREWIIGENTPLWFDDVYLITGSASGTSSSNNSYTAIINSALRKQMSCKHIVSGKFSITPSGKATRLVDFGNGACDNQATVTINGKVYPITLH
jgi:hypothetical protein